jgi:hypothetical protein
MKTPSKPINTHSLIKKMGEIDNAYDKIIRNGDDKGNGNGNDTSSSTSSSLSPTIRKSKKSSILEKLQNDVLMKI